ncbi:MAG TPA: cytochrome c biogenesis protein CcsA [Bacteroidota bacterium]|nr:cytochrome c biogenesis protein CcsA [Bacteroidota bacterium]
MDILKILLPVFYFLLVGMYGRAFFSDSTLAKRIKTPMLIFIVVLHLFYLILRSVEYSHPPVTNVFEIFSVLALAVAATYLVIEWNSHRTETGYFILNIAFFFQLISSLFIKDTYEVKEILRSPLFGIHVSAALIGYAAITIAGAYGFLYLMLYHEMKATRFGVIYKKLPTLESLERMAGTAILIAFLLLGCAIIFGIVWLRHVFPGEYHYDAKLVSTLVVWLLYGWMTFAPRFSSWKGRKLMLFAMIGFAISIFSLTVINIFFSGFHKFF